MAGRVIRHENVREDGEKRYNRRANTRERFGYITVICMLPRARLLSQPPTAS